MPLTALQKTSCYVTFFLTFYHCNFIVSSDGFTYSSMMSRCPTRIPLLSLVSVMIERVPPRLLFSFERFLSDRRFSFV
jgi:hypothetical protein